MDSMGVAKGRARPVCRTCALILLATALGGQWTLEQPAGSTFEYYPCWREIVARIFECGGPNTVRAYVLVFIVLLMELMSHMHRHCFSCTLGQWDLPTPEVRAAGQMVDGALLIANSEAPHRICKFCGGLPVRSRGPSELASKNPEGCHSSEVY